MDMISLYNTKRKWKGVRERRKRNPLSRIVVTSVRPGFEKVVLGITNVCRIVLLAEKSQLREYLSASRESKLLSKGHCFLRGRVVAGGGNQRSQWHQMSPWKSHIPFTLTSSHMALHSLPPPRFPGTTPEC